MYKIITKREIAPNIISLEVAAPLIAKRVKPGQFIILLVDERGERIPVTIADYNRENGWIRIIFQVVGKTTAQLSQMNEGDELFALVGPLGNPSEIDNYGTVVTVGGGNGYRQRISHNTGTKRSWQPSHLDYRRKNKRFDYHGR
ncbi:Dihydroorotate dehydrogenase B (NAD(+)), electron transfer subunit [subsurface metagenome]